MGGISTFDLKVVGLNPDLAPMVFTFRKIYVRFSMYFYIRDTYLYISNC